ncbi:MAG: hypothetical protein AAGI53_05680 [Planctomycetota bacterium]
MKSRATLLMGAVGLAIAGTASGVASGQSSFTCSITNTWIWEGGLAGGDFLTSGNWFDCGGLIPGPTSTLTKYFGPIQRTINGVPQPIEFPASPAVLTSDFMSPSFRIANGTDFTLRVQNAVYDITSTAVVGDRLSDPFPTAGLSTLILDNAELDGSVTIGRNGGRGRLILRNGGFVDGSISFSTGTGEVVNETDSLFVSGTNNTSNGSVSWRNVSGSSLELVNSTFSRSWPDQPAGFVVESGAVVRKTGISSSTIGWDVETSGATVVDQGTLTVSGVFESLDSTVDIIEGSLRLNGPMIGDVNVTTTAAGRFDAIGSLPSTFSVDLMGNLGIGTVAGGGELVLDGVIDVTSASSITGSIVNEADIVLRAFPNNNSSMPASWRNAPGSSLELVTNTGFSRSWPAQPADLIVEPGSLLRKTGNSTSSIGWDISGNGPIVVESGGLSVAGSYQGVGSSIRIESGSSTFSGGFDADNVTVDVLDGVAQVGGDISGFVTATTSPTGSFRVTGTVPDSFMVDVMGRTGVGPLTGDGTATFFGVADIVSSGQLGANVVNSGDLTLMSFPNNNSSRPASWRNVSGSSLNFSSNAGFSRSWPAQPADLIVDSGAELRKNGGSSSSVGWDVNTSGMTVVEDGTLTISGSFESSGSVADVVDGTFRLTGPMTGDVSVTTGMNGRFDASGSLPSDFDIDLEGNLGLGTVAGEGTLTLMGDIDVPSASSLNGSIVNGADLRLRTFPNNNSTVPARWQNVAGSVLELVTNAGFSRSWPAQPADLIVDEGAVLRKTGSSTSSVGWDVASAGRIEVLEGDLNLTSEFISTGVVDVEAGRLVITDPDPKMTEEGAVLTGNGTVSFTQADAILNKGVIAPGLATDDNPDGLTINIPFIQNDESAVFRAQVGVQAGKLTSNGIYGIGGVLEIVRFGDFEPDGTEEFTIIEADFVSGIFGDFFTNAIPAIGFTAQGVVTGDLKFDVEYTSTSVVIKNLSIFVPPCNTADLADPAGVLDLADADAFITLFLLGDPSVDLVEPFGVIDLGDLDQFISDFLGGCP